MVANMAPRLLKRILEAGLGRDLPPELAKRVALTNRLSATIVLITLPYVLIFALAGQRTLGLCVVPVALGYAVLPLLNALGHVRASRAGMVVVGNAAPFAFSLLVGEDAGIHLYLLATLCMPFVLFGKQEKAAFYTSVCLPLALLILLDATNFFGVVSLPVAPEALRWIARAIVGSTAATILAAFVYLYLGTVRFEADLRESEGRLRSIFASVTDVVFLMDKEQRYVSVNPRVRRYGMEPSAMIGKRVVDLIPPDLGKQIEESHRKVLEEGAEITVEHHVPGAEGRAYCFTISLSPARNEAGDVIGIVGVSRDVTEDRRLQKDLAQARDAARAASEAKTFFLANVSHELRTPLSAVLGFAEALVNPAFPTDKRAAALESIFRNARHLNALVGDILDLSLVEAGKLRVERRPISLVAELEGVLDEARRAALSKGLGFSETYDALLPAEASCDPVRLRQIVINVVGNAVKFTSVGRVDVRVRMQPGASESLLVLEVEDTGSGVAEGDASRLFQPFTQADASTSRRFGGTGLGLSLSRALARAMGGDIILAHSEVGKGSVFVVTVGVGTVVASRESGRELAVAAFGSSAPVVDLTGRRALVVDDTADMRDFVAGALALGGCAVDVAADGEEGLARALAGAYDVIFMDVQMPGLDGYEVTRRLRERGCTSRIVALTGRTMSGERAACFAAGCDDFLMKPVDLASLLRSAAKPR